MFVPCRACVRATLRCAALMYLSRPGIGLVSDADADLDAMTERVME